MSSTPVNTHQSGTVTYVAYLLLAYRSSLQESTRESHSYGQDPHLPSVLKVETIPTRQEIDLNSYKGELVAGLLEAWALAQKMVEKAQKAHDKNTAEPNFKKGE